MNSNNMFNEPPWSNAGLVQLPNSEFDTQHWRYFTDNSVYPTSYSNQFRISDKYAAHQMNREFENKHIISDQPFKIMQEKHNDKKDCRTVRKLDGLYMIVHNIPHDFRTDDLRIFFSQFIETGGFVCFHFMRRGEIQTDNRYGNTSCCVIKVDPERASEFIETYNGVPWVDENGTAEKTQCSVKRIIIDDFDSSVEYVTPFARNRPNYRIHRDRNKFHSKDLKRLPETRPPRYMPNGNVGTKLSIFQELNEAGELSAKMVQRLGLGFQSNEDDSLHQDQILTETGATCLHNDVTGRQSKVPKWILMKERSKIKRLKGNKKEKVEAVSLDEFAAFDKYSNGFGRRLMEAQGWRQGQGIGKDGSGMSEPLGCNGQKPTVKKGLGYQSEKRNQKFHLKTEQKDADESEIPLSTSAVNSQEISNQDQKLTETKASGLHNDVTGRQSKVPKWILMKERSKSKRLKGNKKEKVEAVSLDEYAAFDKNSNGFEQKLVEAQGWKQGEGIGKDGSGMSEPFGCDGQKPSVKKELAYQSEKRNPKFHLKIEQKDGDESEIPLSTSAVNSQEISNQVSVSTHMYNSKDQKLTETGSSVNWRQYFNVTQRKSKEPIWVFYKQRSKSRKLRDKKRDKVEQVRLDEFAAFDKYSNGIGRKLMEAQGWKQGEGIGKDSSGMSEPLGCNGQKPSVKNGLGYQSKKANRKYHLKTEQNDSNESEINSKMKFKRVFIKGEDVVSFIYV